MFVAEAITAYHTCNAYVGSFARTEIHFYGLPVNEGIPIQVIPYIVPWESRVFMVVLFLSVYYL